MSERTHLPTERTTSSSYNTFNSSNRGEGNKLRVSTPPESTTDMIVHKLTGKETVQGLSIMYDIPIRDILTANKLWSGDNIHMRDFLYIPHRQQSKKPITTSTSSTENIQQQVSENIYDLINDFKRNTGANEEIARFYVEAYCKGQRNLVLAIQRYHEDVKAGITPDRESSPSHRPLMEDTSDDDGVGYHVAAKPAARPPKHKIPQLENLIDNFYDL